MKRQAFMIGKTVYTADGALLGEVKAAGARYFEIRGGRCGRPSFWLQVDEVISPPWIERVLVSFDQENLEDHKAGHEGD